MATLREVRSRILGVKKTQKFTKAMKMVAAAKLRRSQQSVVAARPYAKKIFELLRDLNASTDVALHPLLVSREVSSVAVVVVTSDRGLCGAFNANLIKSAVAHIENAYATQMADGKLKLFCVGRKGADFLSKRHYPVVGRFVGVYDTLSFVTVKPIARELAEGFLRGDFDRVDVVYNEFKSVTQQRILIEQFLPVPAAAIGTGSSTPVGSRQVNYIYEPSSHHIAGAMVPRHVDFQLWRILLESNAAEQGARMTAMDNATENASELIDTLQLQYNKARQASITKELLEVVAGAEALRDTG
jgi:F-type H+-transporting ATPase subunit gamma